MVIARINIGNHGIEHITVVPETPVGQSEVYQVLGDQFVSEALDLLNRALMYRNSSATKC